MKYHTDGHYITMKTWFESLNPRGLLELSSQLKRATRNNTFFGISLVDFLLLQILLVWVSQILVVAEFLLKVQATID